MSFWQEDDFWLRALCFPACVPSGGALLAKVFGVASMQTVTLFLFLSGDTIRIGGSELIVRA